MKKLRFELTKLIKKRVKDSIIAKIALVLAVFIVFCTTYLLILPALTVSTGSSSSVIQSTENSSSVADESRQDESSSEASQEANNQTESSESAANTTDEAADMVAAGTLSAETSEVTVTVTYEDNTFSEPVTLKVNSVSDTSAINDKLTSELSKTKQSLSQAYSYDISFVTASGEEVEPSKDVNVSLAFKNAVGSSDLQSGWKLYHFVDNDINNVEDLTNKSDTTINQDSSDSATGVEFKSDSFSTYTVAGVTYADFSDYLTDYSYDESSVQEDLSTEELTISLKLSFKINQTNLASEKNYYLVLPDDTSIGDDITIGTEYTGRDSSNIDAFKYKFIKDDSTGKYYVLVTFLDSYVSGMGSGVESTGYINYEAIFGLTRKNDDGGYTVVYSDDVKVEVPAEDITKNYDLTTSKTGTVSYDEDTPYITYTITVDSKYGTPGNIDLTDTLTASGISIDSVDNVSITKSTYAGSTSNITRTETVSKSPTFDTANGTWSLTLDQLTSGGTDSAGNVIGHFYTITYRYKIADLTAGEDVKVSNTVNAVSKDGSDKRETSSSTSVDLKLNEVKKSGKYDSSTGKITWTITVNPNGNDIAGAILKDSFLSEASDLTISPSNGYRIYNTSGGYWDGNDTSDIAYIRFTGKKNTKSYTITYTTNVTDTGWSSSHVKNTVILDDDGNFDTTDDQTKDSSNPSIPGSGDLTKNFVSESDTGDSDVKTISWQTNITMPDSGVIEKGTTFRDILTDPYNQNSEIHWYSKSQLQDLYTQLIGVFGEGNFTLKARQKSSGAYTNYVDLDNSVNYTEFMITLTSDFKSTRDVSFQYTSTAKLSGGATLDFRNKITSGDHSSQVDYHYTDNPNVIKMDGNENPATSTITSKDGIIVWKVKVNLSDDATSMTVTDTLPSGVSLSGLTYGQHWGQIYAGISGSSITGGENDWGTYNINLTGSISDDNVVTLNFSTIDGQTLKNNIGGNNDFWLTFTTFYDNFPEEGTIITDTLTNMVSVIVDGDQDYGSDSQTQNLTIGKEKTETTPMTKTGTWDNINRALHYSLSINPNADDLIDGTDELTLTDVLTFYGTDISVALNQSSVKLYYADSGEEVPTSEWSWKVSSTDNGWGTHTSTLTVKFKDATAYTFAYDYTVSKENSTISNTYWPTNTATLSGISSGTTKTTTEVAWSKIGTDAGIDTEKAYTINKVDSSNYGKGLSGAIFTVYKYDGDCNDCNDEVVATYTTDENGHITISKSNFNSTTTSNTIIRIVIPFLGVVSISQPNSTSGFENGTFYYFKETSAPPGYDLPENPKKYYFYYDSSGWLQPTGVLQDAVNLAKDNGFVYIENEKTKAVNLTVNKKWFTADGDETEHSDGSIIYDVIQVATNECGDSTETIYKSNETLTHDDNWTRTYSELPVSGKDNCGNKVNYTYYVKEHAVSGYDTSYSNSNGDSSTNAVDMAIASDSAEITIENTAQKQYALPETGGNGTQWYYITGAIVSLLTLSLLIFKIYKRYQMGEHL